MSPHVINTHQVLKSSHKRGAEAALVQLFGVTKIYNLVNQLIWRKGNRKKNIKTHIMWCGDERIKALEGISSPLKSKVRLAAMEKPGLFLSFHITHRKAVFELFVVVWAFFPRPKGSQGPELTLFSPCWSTMFSGFRSLWMILFLWR